ncbi:tyrosine-type recombinase/integrase [Micromonospora sp. NPDC007271]|uniref:tyrosine-type recombinase/integrase n=1 Tax=Micromonospora sp. NPDC007271 TaxID=3154587 RepID=UPI0033D4D6F9
MDARSSTPLLDSLTRAGCHATTGSSKAHRRTVSDLGRVPSGLGPVAAGRELPQTTRYNYLLAAAQLGRYLGEHSPDPDAEDAADDPCAVTRAHVEAFQAWMIDTRSASTALNKHKGLQQFFKWLLVDEQAIDRSPMEWVRQPKTPRKLIPVMRDEDTGKLLDACKGKGFANLRDEALIRLYCNTGARLSEVGNLLVADVDLDTESVHFHGKGAKDRRVRFGPKTARALSRYLRARGKHKGAALPNLWLAERGAALLELMEIGVVGTPFGHARHHR